MEVADQWRREWAGTAEYGKVTEGGVTRRVARAMEVLNASGPGAKVRVMRAAFHSTAGPGAPAASFMLHSSRRVISSGFNFLESPSPTQPMKPLEISSTPFETLPDLNTETENYKVTEPDDFDISEPSKWRGSSRGTSLRMPSEESSSTDNASIIDLDARNSKNLHRKYSYDSESSELQFRSRSNSRTSPILETPITLSTLKYKSLLNSSNDWNTRRKSYSFEDTSPLSETILHSNETLAMESSTDSGICKSTELVNEHVEDNQHFKSLNNDHNRLDNREESFKDWLNKNRPTAHYRGTKFKRYREHDTVLEEPIQNNISLQSSGKVSITLPITIEDDVDTEKNQVNEECDRRIKRVEFCKTEVHFTAESGKVNIIATDEKPPPSNDFRKRRSAFVPIRSSFEKPITLFGDKTEFNTTSSPMHNSGSEFSESDENTAATKSILKNKIPKPKPYLLGENMAFGKIDDDFNNKEVYDINNGLTAVSLVNRQLEEEKKYDENKSTFESDRHKRVVTNREFGTNYTGPNTSSIKRNNPVVTNIKITREDEEKCDNVKNKISALHVPQVERKPKTRPLKESDLTYFGVETSHDKIQNKNYFKELEKKPIERENFVDNIFNSVKLIQQVANSVCSSEHESEDTPEYQNLPIHSNYQPLPFPRLRSKFENMPSISEGKRTKLKPNMEKLNQEMTDVLNTRRSKVRNLGEVPKNRSISEPPKAYRLSIKDKSTSSSKHQEAKDILNNENSYSPLPKDDIISDGDSPMYVNLNTAKKISSQEDKPTRKSPSVTRTTTSVNKDKNIQDKYTQSHKTNTQRKDHRIDSDTESSLRKKQLVKQDSLPKHKEKTEKSREDRTIKSGEQSVSKAIGTNNRYPKITHERTSPEEMEKRRSRSLQRSSTKPNKSGERSKERNHVVIDSSIRPEKHSTDQRETSSSRKRNKSKENRSPRDTISSNHNSPTLLIIPEKDPRTKSDHHRVNKRSEYVINYDDKNGTVSSICKINANQAMHKRKKNTKEVKESPKTKAVNNSGPLQIEDHQGGSPGFNTDRKWKTKVNVQRSCQVL